MEQPFKLTSELRDNRLIITTSGYVNNVGGEAIAKEFNQHFAISVKVKNFVEVLGRDLSGKFKKGVKTRQLGFWQLNMPGI